jgi:disulfide bond formation protein DsbB
MNALVLWFRPRWPFFTLLLSGAMLAAAHAFESFGGLAPCPLCLDQREWHWGVVGVSVAAIVLLRFRLGFARLADAALGLVLLGAAGMAAYHVAVEHHLIIAQCDARIDPNQNLTFDIEGTFEAPKCDEPAWMMFGISMAGYNALLSLIVALKSFALALWPTKAAP